MHRLISAILPPAPAVIVALAVSSIARAEPARLIADLDRDPWRGGGIPEVHATADAAVFMACNRTCTAWRTDGTAGGTQPIGSAATAGFEEVCGSNGDGLALLGDRVLLAFDEHVGMGRRCTLWQSRLDDGASVARLGPTAPESTPHTVSRFRVVDGHAFFVSRTPRSNDQVWVTDGTDAGTVPIATFAGTNASSIGVGAHRAFFQDVDTLWVSDGTVAGTFALRSGLGSLFLGFGLDVDAGGLYFFEACGAGRCDVWRSDGTADGTFAITTNGPDETRNPIGRVGTTVFFRGHMPDTGWELWASDGTPDRTHLVADVAAGAADSDPDEPIELAGFVYFAAADADGSRTLWRVPTSAIPGTTVAERVASAPTDPRWLTRAGARLVFVAKDADGRDVLWQIDGGDEGATVLSAVPTTGSVQRLAARGDDVIIVAAALPRPMIFDATTRTIDILPGPVEGTLSSLGLDSTFGSLGKLAFWNAGGSTESTGLWMSDATATGTARLGSVVMRNVGAVVNERLVFDGCTTDAGCEPWITDGTPAGTTLLKDVLPGPGGGRRSIAGGMRRLNDTAYFVGETSDGRQTLWRTDGTSEGTRSWDELDPSPAGDGLAIYDVVDRTLFFRGCSADHGCELWRTDGTAAGTHEVVDINMSGYSTAITETAVVGRWLFLTRCADSVFQLWRTDGTAQGTVLLLSSPGATCPFGMRAIDDVVYLGVHSDTHGIEPYRSDGTPEGTFEIADLNAGKESSSPNSWTKVGGLIYFFASDADDRWLWRTDGTAAGTMRVGAAPSGDEYLAPTALTALGGRLWFRTGAIRFGFDGGTDRSTDAHLWTSDGTDAGTHPALPGFQGAAVNLGGTLAFPAWDTTYGVEPWALPVCHDRDSDGTCDADDACPDQADGDDYDHDGFGDACDPCTAMDRADVQRIELRTEISRRRPRKLTMRTDLVIPDPADVESIQDGIRLLLSAADGAEILLDLDSSAGEWRRVRRGWRYRSRGVGIRSIDARVRRDDPRVRVRLRAVAALTGTPPPDDVIVSIGDRIGLCVESRASALSGACVARHGRLRCGFKRRS